MLIMLYWDLILAGLDGLILGGPPFAPYAPLPPCVHPRPCRCPPSQGRQGSSSRRRPRSLSPEVSVRSVPLWCDQLLFCYDFLL